MSNSFNRKFCVHTSFVQTLLDCEVKWIMNIPLFLTFCTYSREIIDMVSDLTKTLTLAFWQTLLKEGLSNFARL